MTQKTKDRLAGLAGLAMLIVAFAIGRYTVPVKTITVTKTVEVEKKTSDYQDHKVVTIVDTKKPDGTDTKTTIITDNRDDKTTDDTKTDTSQTKEVSKSSDHLTLSLLAGANVSALGTPIYGGMVSKSLLGPINIGAFGMTNKVIGFSLGVSL